MTSKLEKFAEFSASDYGLEYTDPQFKRKLQEFLSSWPRIVVELGCGKAEYTLELSRMSEKVGHIGIDIQGERLWKAAKTAAKEEMQNVLFVRMFIETILDSFPEQSINEIWLTFPDPFLKERFAKKRLVDLRFLEMYKKLLKHGGLLHLKTDSTNLFEYALEQAALAGGNLLNQIEDIPADTDNSVLKIQTTFETKHRQKGDKIKYLQLRFD